MEDKEITELIYCRSEKGISELQKKFSRLIMKICLGILGSREDAEECANDTLLAVWNGIPPEKPDNLMAYVCKIARRKTLNRLRYNSAAMRNSELLSELDECLPSDRYSPEKSAENEELSAALNDWLNTLGEKQRRLFMLRYFYMQPIKEAARNCSMSLTAASTALSRLRLSLKNHLIERGLYNENQSFV